MIINYDEFYEMLEKHIQSGEDFYVKLLDTVITNPNRYCGIFRLSNPKTKLIQNISQSREIKFGDFFEDLTTEYIARLGYKNFDKDLGQDDNGDFLNVDQFFTDDNSIFLVEMKMRDDHDSTKKRGQYSNFHKKVNLIRNRYPDHHIEASMWFVDDSLAKNKNYYRDEMAKETFENTNLNLYYGEEFFASLKSGKQAWDELISLLQDYHKKNNDDEFESIPDFGTSDEIYQALLKLPNSSFKKLVSDKTEYVMLRDLLFSNGNNIEKAINNRK